MPALISKIKAIPDTTFDRAAENFQNTSLWELVYHFNTGDLEAAIATVPEIEAGLAPKSLSAHCPPPRLLPHPDRWKA